MVLCGCSSALGSCSSLRLIEIKRLLELGIYDVVKGWGKRKKMIDTME